MNPWFNRLTATSLVTLLFLGLAWELWLAPLRAGGSMLALKALPLLLPLLGILRGKRYTHQCTSMLALAYLAAGLVWAVTDQGVGKPWWLPKRSSRHRFSPTVSATPV